MWALLKFEWAKMVRSKLTYLGFGLVLGLVLLIFVGFQVRKQFPKPTRIGGMKFSVEQMLSAPNFALWVETPTVMVLMPMFVAVVGGSMMAGEARVGTLRTMLIRPVSRGQVLGAKGVMIVVYTIGIMVFTAVLALGMGFAQFKSRGEVILLSVEHGLFIVKPEHSIERVLASYALTLPTLLSLAMMALMFSVMVEQAATAAMATLGIYYSSMILDELPFGFMEAIKPFLPTHYMFSWRVAYYPQDFGQRFVEGAMNWGQISGDLLWLGVFTASYILVAAWVFGRKDVKS